MFHLHNKLQYYLYPGAVDMRKSFYTLSGIVTSIMKRNVRDGEVFIFVNRNLTIMKILHLEYGGLMERLNEYCFGSKKQVPQAKKKMKNIV